MENININQALEYVRGAEAELSLLIGKMLDKSFQEIDINLLSEISDVRNILFKQEMELIRIRDREERKAMGASHD